jgi:hypothetical protein
MKPVYTKKHLNFLRRNYKKMMAIDLTAAFNKRFKTNKATGAIKSAMKNHKITSGRKCGVIKGTCRSFTKQQIRFLKKGYLKYSLAELHIEFNKKFNSQKSLQQIRCFTRNHRIRSGRTGCFEKGQLPWNTGTKGVCHGSSTSFKKGNIPVNVKPLGYERFDNRRKPGKTNYMHVKVAEKNPYTGAQTRIKLKHIVIWEEHHGPVPKGMAVIFKDSDTTHCEIENLELVSRAELARINQMKYSQAHPEIKPALLTLAKLKTKLFKAERSL